MIFYRKKKGFTFVELMISVGISVGVMAVVFAFYLMTQKFFHVGANRSQLVSETKNAMNRMLEELSRAEEIVDLDEDSITFKAHPFKANDVSGFRDDLSLISYKIDRKNNELIRSFEKNDEVLIKCSSINEDEDNDVALFYPFIKAFDKEGYFHYVPEYTDSEKQERIVFIRVRIKAKLKNEEIDLISGAKLDFMYPSIIQPYWKFN